ncbi:MAG: DUF2779 domain-containing protein [Bacteroidota bacterium]
MNTFPIGVGEVSPDRTSIKSLSKSRVAAGLQCHKRLYLECYAHERRDPLDPARQGLIEVGRQVGIAAREAFPGGVLVSEEPWRHEDAARATREVMQNPAVRAIFEGAFTFDSIRVRVDVLARSDDGAWDVVEVKSSKQVKDDYLSDVALQLHVVEGSGVPVADACVLHLNGDYVWNGGPYEPEELFTRRELTEEVRRRMPELLRRIEAMRGPLWGLVPPDIAIGAHCERPHRCPFHGTCHVNGAEHPIHTLPRMDQRLRRRLAGLGVADIREIPDDFDGLSPLQRRVRQCLIQRRAFVDPDLARELAAVRHPIHFLDFESCSVPLPVIPGTRPFEQTPFQWSDHVLHEDGRVEHRAYLHGARTDPRRPLAESLLTTLDGAGAVVVYSGFEARTMRGLAQAYPDLAAELLDHVERRIVDLQRLVHAHYYHPDLKGSFSIKDVLPVVVDGLGYDDLEIREGSQASLAFATMTDPERPPGERALLRDRLLAYCKRDTEAIMRLFLNLKEGS